MWLRSLRTFAALLAAGLMTGGVLAAARPGTTEQGRAAAAPRLIAVSLGTYKFGAYTAPDAVAAQVDAAGVGWENPPEGVSYGPGTFEVAKDGTVWLLDAVNNRLLGWRPGHPDRPALTVPAPLSAADFAIGPNGTFYLTTDRPGEGMKLTSISSDGQLRWRAALGELLFNAQLRVGPDRRLYQVTPDAWIPVTDSSGNPLTVADQKRETLRYQPLPGGRRLHVTYSSYRAIQVDLADATGRPLTTWRLTSATDLGPSQGQPALAGADVILPLEVFTQTPTWRWERLVLRLTGTGAPVRLHLRHVIWGDTPITELRAGAGSALYQLQTSRTTGVKILRYDLSLPTPTSAPPSTGPVLPAPTTSTAAAPTGTTGTATATPTGAPASTAVAVAPSGQRLSGLRSWIVWAGSAVLLFVVVAGSAFLIWRRHAAPASWRR